MIGPTMPISELTHKQRHRLPNETFHDSCARQANALKDSDEHFLQLNDIYKNQRFLNGGRIQAAVGAPRKVTPFNCYVSGTIGDSIEGIFSKLGEAALTMKLGGGIGYDFSTLRPEHDIITTLGSRSSGPMSFIEVFDTMCRCIKSAGDRRGAMMAMMRVDHPDIEKFVQAKNNTTQLRNFNISVAITDEFMECLKLGVDFPLRFQGKVYGQVNANFLWDEIMRSTWDWAEPGVIFIDAINKMNNLWYCETIAATNPCGEQPLPPYGACLLGSFNLVKYIDQVDDKFTFNFEKFKHDIPPVIRAVDNVIDQAIFPLDQQELEARRKRRMGIGITGLANAIEITGAPYGSDEFIKTTHNILTVLRDTTYRSSISLGIEKGVFDLFDRDKYVTGGFIKTLPEDIQSDIFNYGIRNSHLLSQAPAGTISLTADNVSSGIEPVHISNRIIIGEEGIAKEQQLEDYAVSNWDFCGKLTEEVTPEEHVKVLTTVQKYMDSAVSKTCNIGDNIHWDDFKNVYIQAYEGGAKGCTTYRKAGKRAGIFTENKSKEKTNENSNESEGAACYIDPNTNQRSCE